MMTEVEASKAVVPGPQVWPLSVKAYHALGEMGLIPKQTELLYGQVFRKISKSPLHSGLVRRLLRLLQQHAAGLLRVSGTTHHLPGLRAGTRLSHDPWT